MANKRSNAVILVAIRSQEKGRGGGWYLETGERGGESILIKVAITVFTSSRLFFLSLSRYNETGSLYSPESNCIRESSQSDGWSRAVWLMPSSSSAFFFKLDSKKLFGISIHLLNDHASSSWSNKRYVSHLIVGISIQHHLGSNFQLKNKKQTTRIF